MEEDSDDADSKSEIGYTTEPNPSFTPAKRDDDIGRLAWRLCGSPPDFTAAVPLADAIELEASPLVAMAFKAKVVALMRFLPSGASDFDTFRTDMRRGVVRQLRGSLRSVCAAYLYDFNSVCGTLALLVTKASVPMSPLPTRSAAVTLVYCPLSGGYDVGDRVRMSDGRNGVVIVAQDRHGLYGVMPSANNDPTPDGGDMATQEEGPGYDG